MLIGFIVVIIMILVIVGLMSTGNGTDGNTGVYSSQIKKIEVLINSLETEGVMYHGLHNNFTKFNANYLQGTNIAKELYTDSDASLNVPMDKNHWANLPVDFNCDGIVESNTTSYLGAGRGVFLLKGYVPGNQMALLVNSCKNTNTNYTEIRIVRQINFTYNKKFDTMLEQALMNYNFYYGA